jgi:hypothetical protein
MQMKSVAVDLCREMQRHTIYSRFRRLILAAAIVVIGSSASAFAASLGTTANGLGAGSTVVSACGAGITASYTTAYSRSIPGYAVNEVDLAGIPSTCLRKSYKIQLADASDAPIGSQMTGALPTTGTTATIATSGTPDASLVTDISVVIS